MTKAIAIPAEKSRGFETIKAEAQGPVGRLILNRPARLNAINSTMLLEIAEAARWFDSQDDLRVVIVSGAGRAFCAGSDLTDLRRASGPSQSGNGGRYRRAGGRYGLRMMDALEQMRAITIAQVHGYAVGGGLAIISACDLRIAASNTVFFIPEVEIGIPYGWGGIPRLVRELGVALTKELVLTCRRFTAQELKAMGFMNRVAPASKLAEEVLALANQLRDKPAAAASITKDHVNAVARAMGAGMTGFADHDLSFAAAEDPESKKAGETYAARALHGKKAR